jgi:hypothetical protein
MTQTPSNSDLALVKLAREIAMDIQPVQNILKQYAITDETWSELQRNTRFLSLLSSEVEAWQTALNTHERVKLKSAAMLEEWLPELYRRMHDCGEAMPAIIEAGKMLARIAGMGLGNDAGATIGERFVINISMGERADPVTFAKDITSQVTIEHEASAASSGIASGVSVK